MKICITGTHSSGKTTLINHFVDKYPQFSYSVIEEIARKLISSGVPMGKEATLESYIIYIKEQLQAEIHSSRVIRDILFADRSLLDGLAYPIVNNMTSNGQIPGFFLEMFESVLYFQKSFFDLYIYLPLETPMQPDPVRPDDDSYRIAVDLEIKRLLDKHIKCYHTIRGTLDERCDQLFKLIATSC